jgi:hypothetical protein
VRHGRIDDPVFVLTSRGGGLPAQAAPARRGTTMSVILRILFVLAGFLAALFVARDSLNFDLVQTWVAIVLVAIAMGVGGLWALRRKT